MNDKSIKEYQDFNGGPQPEWFTQYAGSQGKSHGHFIIQTHDGGYFQVGETGFVQSNNAITYVVKTNSKGKKLWSVEMGEEGHNLGNSCVEDEDGNYIMAGGLNKQSCLVKFNSRDGEILWSRIYPHRSEAAIEGIDIDERGGFICVGYELGHGEHNFYTAGKGYLLKCDKTGRAIWQRDISEIVGQAYRVRTLDDGYLIQGVDLRDFLLLKTDFSGNTVWNKRYGTTGEEHNFGMDIGKDGSVFLTGHTRVRENWDTYTVKTDKDGNEQWSKIAGQPRGYDANYIHDEAWGIAATPDGGCVVAAGSGDEYEEYTGTGSPFGPSNKWVVYLIKYSSDGVLEWEGIYRNDGSYPGHGHWAGEDIALTRDGGAIIAVDSSQFGFLKLAPF